MLGSSDECVGNGSAILQALKERLFLNMPVESVPQAVESLIHRSYDHFGTNQYDNFQAYSNGICK
jgi:hypothetical protein